MSLDKWFESFAGLHVGDYVLDRYINRGKIGCVYEAHDNAIPDRKVAIKINSVILKSGWETELKKVAKLQNITGVVQFHGLDSKHLTHNNRTELLSYTVWDYIHPGRNLKSYLNSLKACPASFYLAVIENILNVLYACEKRGILRHGDLHLGNILIGEDDEACLDSATLNPRLPIYVSDFGYGTSDGEIKPKDDYKGLAEIADAIILKVDWDASNTTDRQTLEVIRDLLRKVLKESSITDRTPPLEILKAINERKYSIRSKSHFTTANKNAIASVKKSEDSLRVGVFQVTEMLGDDWDKWRQLFVSSVPARSRILEPDIPTVVTGPRGCGKTMLFKRLSERLMVECGPLETVNAGSGFVGFYVNANDFADAFALFPDVPNELQTGKLIAYSNICILADVLSVESALAIKQTQQISSKLIEVLSGWLFPGENKPKLITGEDSLERHRQQLEKIRWNFPKKDGHLNFPAFDDFSRNDWLPKMFSKLKELCGWIGTKKVFLFIDDYTTPRVSFSMQKVLNRSLLRRSDQFVAKISTEAATTFISVDSSEKNLQDGDDYQLIDLGEESLFLEEKEKQNFLGEVFKRRLKLDDRVPSGCEDLEQLLGHLGLGKLEFARQLRNDDSPAEFIPEKRRGSTKPKVLYHGVDVFVALWSGDTRMMIQLMQNIFDEAPKDTSGKINVSIGPEFQDRSLRNRGSQWLEAHSRNEPTNPAVVDREIEVVKKSNSDFKLSGNSYGAHLKAIVEAFKDAARALLMGPTYRIGTRIVPRMAFRIEILDTFRVEGLAAEIYKDLIRYGLFMRDARGKSVRGAMVPRLYLRRLLLPYCTLPLSKRDSVQLTCEKFIFLLLEPDKFQSELSRQRKPSEEVAGDQTQMQFISKEKTDAVEDSQYDDLDELVEEVEK